MCKGRMKRTRGEERNVVRKDEEDEKVLGAQKYKPLI